MEPESTDPFFSTVHKTVGSLYGKYDELQLYACLYEPCYSKQAHVDVCKRCCCVSQNRAEVVGKGIAAAATLKGELGQMRLVVLVGVHCSTRFAHLVGMQPNSLQARSLVEPRCGQSA